MTASMVALREALIERLAPVPGLSGTWYDPLSIEPPGTFVMPDDPFVDYQKPRESYVDEWYFVVAVAVLAIDEETGQRELDEYLSTGPGALIVPLLRDPDQQINDSLSRMTNRNVWPTRGGRYRELMKDFTRYQTAQIKVRLWA